MHLHFFSCRNKLPHGLARFVTRPQVLNHYKLISKSTRSSSFFRFIGDRCCRYVKEILESTSSEVEQVTLGPRGDWYYGNGQDNTNGYGSPNILGGDDLIEIANPSSVIMKRESSSERRGLNPTPVPTQRSSFSSPRPSGGKRSAAVVIDLTGSDDDDDIHSTQKVNQNESQIIRNYPSSRSNNSNSNSNNNNKRIKLSVTSDSMSPSSSINYYSP
jgi:E3 SUMO-protein ligase PIAS1